MVHLIPTGSSLLVQSTDPAKHLTSLVTDLSQQCLTGEFTNVTITCKGGVQFHLSHVMLAHNSGLLANVFRRDHDFLNIHYNIVCPDFNPEAMKNVLSLLYHGKTFINSINPVELISDMEAIRQTLLLNIDTECSQSGRSFNTNNSQLQDSGISDGDFTMDSSSLENPPLICSICDLIFANSEDLDLHATSHIDPKEDFSGFGPQTGCEDKISKFLAQVDPEEYLLPIVNENGCIQPLPEIKADDLHFFENIDNRAMEATAMETSNFDQNFPTAAMAPFSSSTPTPKLVQCPVCKKKFKCESDLVCHKDNCPKKKIVDKSSSVKVDWTSNLDKDNTISQLAPSSTSTPKRTMCFGCRKKFRNKTDLLHHKDVCPIKNFEGKSTQVKEKSIFQCIRCPKRIVNQFENFLVHIMSAHFAEEFTRSYGLDPTVCGKCDKKLASRQTKLYHVVNTHQAVKDHLSEDDWNKVLAQKKSPSPQLEVTESEEDIVDVTFEEPTCNLCSFKAPNHSSILAHMFNAHYIDHVDQVRDFKCNICGDIKETKTRLMAHLVAKHKILDKITATKKTDVPDSKMVEDICTDGKNEKTKKDSKTERDLFAFQSECRECLKWEGTNRSSFLKHLAMSHFQDFLQEHFGDEEGECKVCSVVVVNSNALRIHLAISHNLLDQFLPPSLKDSSSKLKKPKPNNKKINKGKMKKNHQESSKR